MGVIVTTGSGETVLNTTLTPEGAACYANVLAGTYNVSVYRAMFYNDANALVGTVTLTSTLGGTKTPNDTVVLEGSMVATESNNIVRAEFAMRDPTHPSAVIVLSEALFLDRKITYTSGETITFTIRVCVHQDDSDE